MKSCKQDNHLVDWFLLEGHLEMLVTLIVIQFGDTGWFHIISRSPSVGLGDRFRVSIGVRPVTGHRTAQGKAYTKFYAGAVFCETGLFFPHTG